MASLEQFPVAPKRPRNAPGNDGYYLHREPGYANEQKVYRIVCEVGSTNGNNTDGQQPLMFNWNYPAVKLGFDNYVLDLERVNITYSYDVEDVTGIAVNGAYSCTARGVGQTMRVDKNGKCKIDMDHQFFLPTLTLFKHPLDGDIQKITATYSKSTSTNSSVETSINIEKDNLTMQFDISDANLFRISGGTGEYIDMNNLLIDANDQVVAGQLSDVTVEREYHFIVRPNPLKSSMFEHDHAAW